MGRGWRRRIRGGDAKDEEVQAEDGKGAEVHGAMGTRGGGGYWKC